MGADLADLEERIGYTFQDRDLLVRALTHKSFAFDHPGAAHNEQLEFFGDAVLGFLVSEYLIEAYLDSAEGELSRLRARMVNAAHLEQVASDLDIGRYLFLGRSEEMSGGRSKKTLLGDAIEALVAALYVDGSLKAARDFVRRWVLVEPVAAGPSDPTDYKTALQEMLQVMKLPAPRYVVVRSSGPDHKKTFTMELRVGSQYSIEAQGPTKKSAGQLAARKLIEQLQQSAQ